MTTPETLTTAELDALQACVDYEIKNGAWEFSGVNLEELRSKLWRMISAARAATSCEEAAGQLG